MSSASSPSVITGASGFVGRTLMPALGGATSVALGGDDWRERIAAAPWKGAVVYHLAARVHRDDGDEAAYERDNLDKTRVLAEAAAAGGARRLVFLSTIKVNGEETTREPFRAADQPAPADAYARSKWAAEQALHAIAERTGLETVIVRSPLVVGAGASGNLRSLLRVADGPWPLPFASIDNRRTFVSVEDLARLLEICGAAPNAVGRTYVAGDPRPVATPDLLSILRRAFKRAPRLFALPRSVLESVAAVAGQGMRMRRLTRSLEVDPGETMRELEWTPSGVEGALERTALAFRSEQARA